MTMEYYGGDHTTKCLTQGTVVAILVLNTLQNYENSVLWLRMMSRLGEATSQREEATLPHAEATSRHGEATSRQGEATS